MANYANDAKYHQLCRLQYDNTKLQRAEKEHKQQAAKTIVFTLHVNT